RFLQNQAAPSNLALKTSRDGVFTASLGPSRMNMKWSGCSLEDEIQNRPKLHDRITCFRKSAVREEEPLIQHPIDTQPTISEIPLAQALVDERCMNLSEKEVMDLLEKMMQDMNLNEDCSSFKRRGFVHKTRDG
uniref:Uncharacterized protein n=1 Tax=Pavo cristatus TaxID=9049 RepID=A0A8C9FFT8_PAVCR